MRLSPKALLALALTLSALPCAAQPAPGAPSAADEERRTALFREGKAAADAGRWGEAAEKFRQVVALRSAPKALIALGVAEQRRGRLVAAHAAFKQAREEAADQALTDDLKTANTALDAIRPRLPKLVFTPQDALAGATLEVDGAEARPDDGVLLIDPGDHVLNATSPGKGTFRTTVSLQEGEEHEVDVVFSPASGASTAGPGPDRPPGKGGVSAPPAGAIVTAAAGVALAAAGGALYGVGSDEYAKSDALCPGASCTPDVLDRGNGARTQIIAGDILMIAGGLALAGGAVWWIVSATGSKKKQDAPVSVFLAPRPSGLGLGGRF